MGGFATYVLSFALALGALILAHELGHFLAAKRAGVRVVRFSVGFGPVLLARRWGETEYALSAIPLGGYIRMLGEEAEGEGEEISAADVPHAFSSQRVGVRTLIVAAGPFFNLAFAFALYVATHLAFGVPTPVGQAKVRAVRAGSPAAAAGFAPGDVVTAIDGQPVATWDELARAVRESGGRELRLRVRRGQREIELRVTPRREAAQDIFGEPAGYVYVIGVERDIEVRRVGPLRAVTLAAERTAGGTMLIVGGLARMIAGKVPLRRLGGPIAIARAAGERAEEGLGPYLAIMAFLSLNLAVLNILPIPALDGGHLVFLAIEGLRRRPLRARHREIAQQVGILLIITLMVFVIYNDIHRLVFG